MDARETPTVPTLVLRMEQDIEELKTRQLTSQDSGMLFKDIQSVSGTIDFKGQYNQYLNMVTNYFTPAHNRPVICVPSFEFSPAGYTLVKEYENDSMNYVWYSVYSGSTLVGTIDLYRLFHRSGTVDGTYAWTTLVYTSGESAVFNLPFTITMKATDTGTHTVQVEKDFA